VSNCPGLLAPPTHPKATYFRIKIVEKFRKKLSSAPPVPAFWARFCDCYPPWPGPSLMGMSGPRWAAWDGARPTRIEEGEANRGRPPERGISGRKRAQPDGLRSIWCALSFCLLLSNPWTRRGARGWYTARDRRFCWSKRISEPGPEISRHSAMRWHGSPS